jgi:hypothetical protein
MDATRKEADAAILERFLAEGCAHDRYETAHGAAVCQECGKSVELPIPHYLTAAEFEAVAAMRAAIAAREREKELASHVMSTAAAYLNWLRKEGAGSTFSTFCDDFAYLPHDPETSMRPVYEAVMNIIGEAEKYAKNH